jgi:hypothetical protein
MCNPVYLNEKQLQKNRIKINISEFDAWGQTTNVQQVGHIHRRRHKQSLFGGLLMINHSNFRFHQHMLLYPRHR